MDHGCFCCEKYREVFGEKMKKRIAGMVLGGAMILGLTGCGEKKILDPAHPAVISVWHYYNGAQQDAFDSLVEEFNNTKGKEEGIYVEAFSYGTVTDLVDNVMASIDGKAGAEELPNIFASYVDTALQVDQRGYVASLDSYFTQEELEKYVDGYLGEGRFSSDGSLKIIPVAKSVELMMLNKTDWDIFSAATGADIAELDTMEGLCRIAQQYYEWTDASTPQPDDGKAFFGRDAMANYMLIGYRQLGEEMFSVEDGKVTLHFDRDAVKSLWDAYYIPYVKGYFTSEGRFRSDDVKTGAILCCVASSSSATYFPKEVILSDEESYPIEMITMPCPKFENGGDYAVQQGAGMLVTKAEEKEQLASVEFLKWLTQDEQNIRFSSSSGYLPVTKSANQEASADVQEDIPDCVKKALESGKETVRENEMYFTKAFEGSSDCRTLLETVLQEAAVRDRQTVEERLTGGMTLEDAVEEFCQEEYFDSWYQETKNKLEALLR